MNKANDTVAVSLGISCQTTHQLQRLTDNQSQANTASSTVVTQSSIFDWLICPVESTIALLNQGIPDFTRDSISIRNDHPYWTEYNLYLWHNFQIPHPAKRIFDIDKTFEKEIARWRYLRDQFSSLNPAHTLFVVSNTQNNLATEVFTPSEESQYHFTTSSLDALKQCLAKYFRTGSDNIRLAILTRQDRSSGLNNIDDVTFLPIDSNQWKGSKESWNNWWKKLDLLQPA